MPWLLHQRCSNSLFMSLISDLEFYSVLMLSPTSNLGISLRDDTMGRRISPSTFLFACGFSDHVLYCTVVQCFVCVDRDSLVYIKSTKEVLYFIRNWFIILCLSFYSMWSVRGLNSSQYEYIWISNCLCGLSVSSWFEQCFIGREKLLFSRLYSEQGGM